MPVRLSDSYTKKLHSYLEGLEKSGASLPGVRNLVCFNLVASDAGLPATFLKDEKAKNAVRAAASKLGVSFGEWERRKEERHLEHNLQKLEAYFKSLRERSERLPCFRDAPSCHEIARRSGVPRKFLDGLAGKKAVADAVEELGLEHHTAERTKSVYVPALKAYLQRLADGGLGVPATPQNNTGTGISYMLISEATGIHPSTLADSKPLREMLVEASQRLGLRHETPDAPLSRLSRLQTYVEGHVERGEPLPEGRYGGVDCRQVSLVTDIPEHRLLREPYAPLLQAAVEKVGLVKVAYLRQYEALENYRGQLLAGGEKVPISSRKGHLDLKLISEETNVPVAFFRTRHESNVRQRLDEIIAEVGKAEFVDCRLRMTDGDKHSYLSLIQAWGNTLRSEDRGLPMGVTRTSVDFTLAAQQSGVPENQLRDFPPTEVGHEFRKLHDELGIGPDVSDHVRFNEAADNYLDGLRSAGRPLPERYRGKGYDEGLICVEAGLPPRAFNLKSFGIKGKFDEAVDELGIGGSRTAVLRERHAVADTYLARLRDAGQPLPESTVRLPQGRPIFDRKALCAELGLPTEHWLWDSSGLKSKFDAAALELGIGVSVDPSRYPRVLPPDYKTLIYYGREKLKRTYKDDLARVNVATTYLRGLGEFAGRELDKHFQNLHEDEQLAPYLQSLSIKDSQNDDKKGKSKNQAAHYLNTWKSLQSAYEVENALPPTFGQALKVLMDSTLGANPRTVASVIGVKSVSVRKWICGKSEPHLSLEAVEKLEHLFKIPTGSLSGRVHPSRTKRNSLDLEDFQAFLPERACGEQHYARVCRAEITRMLPKRFHALGHSEQVEALKSAVSAYTENGFRQNISRINTLTYSLPLGEWTPSMQAEWGALKESKTQLAPLPGFSRNGSWGEKSWQRGLRQLESFYGFLLLPKTGARPELTGAGFKKEDLTMALLLVPELIQAYLNYLYKTRGRGYNKGVLNHISFIGMLSREKTGWVRQNEATFRPPLENSFTEKFTGVGWDTVCDSARDYVYGLKAGLSERGILKQRGRDPFLPILPIVNHDQPLSFLDQMHKLMLKHYKVHNTLMADKIVYRNCFLSMLLANFFLRRSNWAGATYRSDNTGHLYQGKKGDWYLRFRVRELKNAHSSIFKNLSPDDLAFDARLGDELQAVATHYINIIRPFLLAEKSSDALFISARGDALPVTGIYTAIFSTTKRFLSQHDKRGLCITGVQPFGPHAYRHIGATHTLTVHNSVERAADLLMDSVDVVKKCYARWLPGRRFEQAIDLIRSGRDFTLES